MSAISELTRLFARLASDLRQPNAAAHAGAVSDNGDEVEKAVSSLAHSLNPDGAGTARVRVLDAALSLMCFKSTMACNSRIECTVQTIVAVLSSLSSCRVLRFPGGGQELLQVGNSISHGDCCELIQACVNVIKILEANGRLLQNLLYAVLKAALSSSCCSSLCQTNAEIADRTSALSELAQLLPEDIPANYHGEIPMRLILWYLDPLILKHDVSQVLRETIQRPFLCLRKELHIRLAWHSVVICLVTSPTMFIETRALLHRWFLLTGWDIILELKVGITSAALDVLSRPMWWGVPMELGLKYPISHAYFPNISYELLTVLTGPISRQNFLDLAFHIKVAAAPVDEYLYPITSSQGISKPAGDNKMVHHNSIWALLSDFPAWFYYATALIFHRRNFSEGEAVDDLELLDAAMVYISSVLFPGDQVHSNLLVDLLNETSMSWTSSCIQKNSHKQQACLDTHDKNTRIRSTKLRIPKSTTYEKPHMTTPDDSCSQTRLWLSEFHSNYAKFFSIPSEGRPRQSGNQQTNLLLLKIPLGILISCPANLDEKGAELLLHYAATGEILSKGYPRHGDPVSQSSQNSSEWAVNGARLVFNFMDLLEDISIVIFDTEDARVNFYRQVKAKVSPYLLLCVNVLLDLQFPQFQIDEVNRRDTMLDLYNRLMNWKEQNQRDCDGNRVLDIVLDKITCFASCDEDKLN